MQFTTRTCLGLHYKSEGVTGIERMEIIPFQSCGKLLFGMTREQVEAVLGDAGRDEGADGCLPNAQLVWYCNMRYHICYLDGRMEWVEVPNPEDENSDVSLYGICLFQSRAEDAVRALEQYGACIHDCPDPELSYTCWFENLGVTLWRDQIYHPKRMKEISGRCHGKISRMCCASGIFSLWQRNLKSIKRCVGHWGFHGPDH